MTYYERIKYAFKTVGEGKPALIILDYYSMIATEIKVNSAIILLKLEENMVSFISITWPNSALMIYPMLCDQNWNLDFKNYRIVLCLFISLQKV